MHIRFRLLFACALALSAGVAAPTGAEVKADDLAAGSYRWFDDGPLDGPLYMVVSLERQMIHVYSGDRLIGMASVSTGTKGHGTPTGEFPILQKRQWHRSNLYSNAPMPFMQRLTWDGIALHAGHNPGYPASHGCIRLPYAFAQRLFGMTKIGSLAQVTQDRLSAALMVDPLLLGDPGSTVVTFDTAGDGAAPAVSPAILDAPRLEVDPSVFGPWRRTERL